MAKRFKRLGTVRKSYEAQGLIYFACRDYKNQPAKIREKIDRLCSQAAGDYAPALFEFLTTDADWVYITQKYFISSATLDRARTEFYNAW